jgi:hypothetical protein
VAGGASAGGAGVTRRAAVVPVRGGVLGRGCGAVTLTSGSLVSGDAVCCAVAGWELRANKTDVKAVEARKLALRPGAVLGECMCEPRDVVARHRERSFTTRQRARLVQLLSVHPDRHARA